MKTEGTMQTHVAPPFKASWAALTYRCSESLIGLPFSLRAGDAGSNRGKLRAIHYCSDLFHDRVLCELLLSGEVFPVQTTAGFSSATVLIATAMILVHLLMHLLPPPEFHRPRPAKELQEVIGFFIVNAMLYALVRGLSVAIKMTSGWYQVESARRELERAVPKPNCKT